VQYQCIEEIHAHVQVRVGLWAVCGVQGGRHKWLNQQPVHGQHCEQQRQLVPALQICGSI
jgi:hypothetical protein